MNKQIIVLLFIFTFSSCQNSSLSEDDSLQKDFTIESIEVPSNSGGEPNLFVSSTGKLFLSWIENRNDSIDALVFSTLINGEWEKPKEMLIFVLSFRI